MMSIACPIQQQTFHLVKLHCRAHMTVRRPNDTITCVKGISTSSLSEQSQRVVHEITAPYEWAAKEGDISDLWHPYQLGNRCLHRKLPHLSNLVIGNTIYYLHLAASPFDIALRHWYACTSSGHRLQAIPHNAKSEIGQCTLRRF